MCIRDRAKISELETQSQSSEEDRKRLEARFEAKAAEADRISKANQDQESEISRLRSKTEQLEQERTNLELKASRAMKKAKAAREELSSAQTEFAFHDKRSLVNKKKSNSASTKKVAKKTVAKPKTARTTKTSSGSTKSVQAKKGSSKSKPDSLKKIEGIGPKIEQLLHAAGIKTFRKLANSSQKKLATILKDAGPRFASKSPETWPEQAKLAADGEWDKLQKLQDLSLIHI